MSKKEGFIDITKKDDAQIPAEGVPCLFKIWFDSNYYFGRAKFIRKRIASIKHDLNRQYPTWHYDEDQNHYYRKILNYLSRQTSDKIEGKFEVIKEYKTEEELVNGEKAIIEQIKLD